MLALAEATPSTLDDHRGLVDRIAAGEAVGLVVRRWVSDDALEAAIAHLERMRSRLPIFELAAGAVSIGCMLAPTEPRPRGPDFECYLDAAERCERLGLLPGALSTIHQALAILAARPVEVPRAPDGRPYARATIRVFDEGAGAPLHCDTYRDLPALRHLHGLAHGRPHLSWYLPLSMPPRGGELTVVDRRHGERREDVQPASRRYRVEPGDLVVFDAGRWFHRVEPGHGGPSRRTLGGFAAIGRTGSRLYAWG